MNKLTITLKQHTPLLHFQPMQEGATLRASEVKPKLDKFLIEKLGEGNYDQGVEIAKQKGWLLMDGKNDCKALNYKMRIESSNPIDMRLPISEHTVKVNGEHELAKDPYTGDQLYKTNNYPLRNKTLIIGNIEGKREEDVLNFVYYENTDAIIRSTSSSLINHIAKHVVEFFSIFNFGNRKSKGFGSYEILKIDGNDVDYDDEENGFECLAGINLVLAKDRKRDTDLNLENVLTDVFCIINGIWEKCIGGKKNNKAFLGNAPKQGVAADRTPSVIYFKPCVYNDGKKYDVFIYCFVDKEVVDNLSVVKEHFEESVLDSISLENIKSVLRSFRPKSWIDYNKIEIN